MSTKPKLFLSLLLVAMFLSGCGENYTIEEKAYINSVEQHREKKNEWN